MYDAGTVISLIGGQYRLREPLAGAAYGVVWRADSLHATGDVALKLVNLDQMARAPEALRSRWLESARTEPAHEQPTQATPPPAPATCPYRARSTGSWSSPMATRSRSGVVSMAAIVKPTGAVLRTTARPGWKGGTRRPLVQLMVGYRSDLR